MNIAILDSGMDKDHHGVNDIAFRKTSRARIAWTTRTVTARTSRHWRPRRTTSPTAHTRHRAGSEDHQSARPQFAGYRLNLQRPEGAAMDTRARRSE